MLQVLLRLKILLHSLHRSSGIITSSPAAAEGNLRVLHVERNRFQLNELLDAKSGIVATPPATFGPAYGKSRLSSC